MLTKNRLPGNKLPMHAKMNYFVSIIFERITFQIILIWIQWTCAQTYFLTILRKIKCYQTKVHKNIPTRKNHWKKLSKYSAVLFWFPLFWQRDAVVTEYDRPLANLQSTMWCKIIIILQTSTFDVRGLHVTLYKG